MGKPAARVADMHMCPMVTPGIPSVPHVGGPINGPGCPTVLIGGMPAAVIGDLCTCVGPPDIIILGSSCVLIGGKPAARMGDSCGHGGTITVGFPSVLIGDAGGGLESMSINALKSVLNNSSSPITEKVELIIMMKQAAEHGIPLVHNPSNCKICKR